MGRAVAEITEDKCTGVESVGSEGVWSLGCVESGGMLSLGVTDLRRTCTFYLYLYCP